MRSQRFRHETGSKIYGLLRFENRIDRQHACLGFGFFSFGGGFLVDSLLFCFVLSFPFSFSFFFVVYIFFEILNEKMYKNKCNII